MAESSVYGLVQYLQQLSDGEFLRFKKLLRADLEKFKPKEVSWAEIVKASEEELATLLSARYLEHVWDVVLNLFGLLGRRDLCNVAKEQGLDTRITYKEGMKHKFQYIWDMETCTYISDKSYYIVVDPQYRALQELFASPSNPVTAVVLGSRGIGKSVFLRRAMLDWASGKLWQDRFRYVFFLTLYEINHFTEMKLTEFILKELSRFPDTLDDVLSHPESILFILEGFDHLKFDLELRTNLSTDCRQRKPVQIVLSSLLQKTILPESSLLLELGSPSEPKIYPLLQYPRAITLAGFSQETMKLYCVNFLFSVSRGLEAFEYIKSSSHLLSLCYAPYMCWLFCNIFKWQLEAGEEKSFGTTDSAFYTCFVMGAFKSMYASCPSNQNRARIKPLCTLAIEGMWKQVFRFSSEDLTRNGISDADKVAWLKMNFLQHRRNSVVFYHPEMQAYFAAMYYFLGQDKAHSIIGSLSQLLKELYAQGQTIKWLHTGMFVFGITNEKVIAMLKQSFGFIAFKEVRQEIMKCCKSLSQQEPTERLVLKSLMSSLIDCQDKRFETQVLDLFEEMTVDIRNSDELSEVAYSLSRCQKLKKLRMRIQNKVFPETTAPGSSDIEELELTTRITNDQWELLCRGLKNLQAMELDSCHFNETAILILREAMSPSSGVPLNAFKLQNLSCSFMTNFGDGLLFCTVLQLPHLRHLNLYGTNLSCAVVSALCCGLRFSACKVEELLLGKCNLSSEACAMIAAVLVHSKVKHLSLVENPLRNKGVMSLCATLKHPSCVLEKLMLSYCCLNFISCGFISAALLLNKSLSLLDLGSNFLEDSGVIALCEPLKNSNCPLQELWLSGCCFTSVCCKEIAAVITTNKNLKTLQLGNNNIQATGVKQLCEALRHPNCKLQCLGLDMCEVTTDCCEDLALALTTCKTLSSLSLDWITLDHAGLMVLCEALLRKDCNLKMLGLDKSAYPEELQVLLQDVEKRKPHLTILHYPWAEEERKRRGVRLTWDSEN